MSEEERKIALKMSSRAEGSLSYLKDGCSKKLDHFRVDEKGTLYY